MARADPEHGLRGGIERWRSSLRALSDRLRRDIPAIDVGWRIFEKDREERGGMLAAAIAYRLFLFVIPLIFVVVTAIGFVATLSDKSPRQLARSSGIGGVIATAVNNAGNLSTLNRTLLLIGGLYATYSAAKSALFVFDASHSAIWNERRRRLKGLVPSGAFIGLALAGFFVISLTARLRSAAPAAGLTITFLFGLLPFLGWIWASTHLAHGDAPRWALVPGGVVMALGVHLVHLFTVFYVSRQVTNKSETYGALGIAMAVLLWAYVVGRLVVLAAVTNAALWERHVQVVGEDDQEEPLQRWPLLWWGELKAMWVHPDGVMADPADSAEAHAVPTGEEHRVPTLTVWRFDVPDGADKAEATLLLLSDDAVVDRVHDALQGVEARLVTTDLSREEEAKLREVFHA